MRGTKVNMKDDSEFYGKKFYPSSFFWQNQSNEPEKVRQVCRVLNTLTKEQIEAVEYLIRDTRLDEAFSNDSDN